MGGTPIEEFVGLRSKMYSIKASDGTKKNTAKGVSRSVSENVLTHEDYRMCLMQRTSMKNKMTRFLNKDHQITTVEQVKTSLSPFNDKRYIQEDGVSHAFGYMEGTETDLVLDKLITESREEEDPFPVEENTLLFEQLMRFEEGQA
jgi:hypothetical protein